MVIKDTTKVINDKGLEIEKQKQDKTKMMKTKMMRRTLRTMSKTLIKIFRIDTEGKANIFGDIWCRLCGQYHINANRIKSDEYVTSRCYQQRLRYA